MEPESMGVDYRIEECSFLSRWSCPYTVNDVLDNMSRCVLRENYVKVIPSRHGGIEELLGEAGLVQGLGTGTNSYLYVSGSG